jgi:hypothetical protein
MEASVCYCRTQLHVIHGIHIENAHRDTPSGYQAHDHHLLRGKVLLPHLMAWMKERHKSTRLRINPSKISAFMRVTVITGERKIRGLITPAMLPGNNVFNVKEGKGKPLNL